MNLSNRKWRYLAAAGPVLVILAWWLFRPNANVRKVRAMQAAMTPRQDARPAAGRASRERPGVPRRGAKAHARPAPRRVRRRPQALRRVDEKIREDVEGRENEIPRRSDRPDGTPAAEHQRAEHVRQRPRRGRSEADRKQRLDQSTPEFRAAMDQFRKDMASRRQQRELR